MKKHGQNLKRTTGNHPRKNDRLQMINNAERNHPRKTPPARTETSEPIEPHRHNQKHAHRLTYWRDMADILQK